MTREMPEKVKRQIQLSTLKFMAETGLKVEDVPAIQRFLSEMTTITTEYLKTEIHSTLFGKEESNVD